MSFGFGFEDAGKVSDFAAALCFDPEPDGESVFGVPVLDMDAVATEGVCGEVVEVAREPSGW